MKRNGAVGLLVSVLVLASAGPALGGADYPSRISIGYSRASGGQFTGNVQSRAVCADRRNVVVYRKQAGRDASVGRVKTSARGRWNLRTGKPRRGDYYARALPGKAARGVRCGGARSAVTHVS